MIDLIRDEIRVDHWIAAVAGEPVDWHEISDGWGPLAELLDVPVPDAPFPPLNDTAAFRAMMGMPAPQG